MVIPPPAEFAAPAPQVLPRRAYTPWIRRVFALIVDVIPVVVLNVLGWAVLLTTRQSDCFTDPSGFDIGPFCSTGASAAGQLAVPVAALLSVIYEIWNWGYRQGKTGSSLGKSLLKFVVVGESTWQPIGFGRSVARQLAHLVDGVTCYLGFLFPLWDSKRQTLADKLMSTVCVPAPVGRR